MDFQAAGPTSPRIESSFLASLMASASPAFLIVDSGLRGSRTMSEALFTISNGYAATSGSPAGRSGTLIAGVFDRGPAPHHLPQLALAPPCLDLRLLVDGTPRDLQGDCVIEHQRTLDVRRGLVWHDLRHVDRKGRATKLRVLQLASQHNRNLIVQAVQVTPENYTGRLRLESRIEDSHRLGSLTSTGQVGLNFCEQASLENPGLLLLCTQSGAITVAFATAGQLSSADGSHVPHAVDMDAERLVDSWEWDASPGTTYQLNRFVAMATSRETDRPADLAERVLEQGLSEGLEAAVAAHIVDWSQHWLDGDVTVQGDPDLQLALRVAAYHLLSAVDPTDERVSVGARGLTGAAYNGHVFWDTELFMFPYYALTYPEAARSLLMYRYFGLDSARKKAASLGYRGALYPWESANNEEATPPDAVDANGDLVRILTGEQEHHISADVAYAVWQYWQASGDDAFMREAGAEILIETARFWASRGESGPDGLYHIRTVIGPDEYHESVDDNAYTNVMVQWNLERAAEIAARLQQEWPDRWRELAEQLAIGEDELSTWLHIAETMYTGFDPATGLFEQFQGYYDLEEIDLRDYEGRVAHMDILLGHEGVRRSNIVKQADVVMLLYLLWDRFPAEVREANFRFYEPRCGHGSSLSPAIHAAVAARLGDIELAERYLKQSAAVDLHDSLGNASEGVHMGAQGGFWQSMVFGFAGLTLGAEGPAFAPHLPEQWQELKFTMQWHGQRLRVAIDSETGSARVTPVPQR